MKPRTARSARTVLALCALLAVVAGCGDGARPRHGAPAPSASASEPAASRPPAPGKGSRDPDDINGDGHRDLLVPVYTGDGSTGREYAQRIMVLYGSSHGPDGAARTVYRPEDLGLPAAVAQPSQQPRPFGIDDSVLTADLDGDGFPDFITTVEGERREDASMSAPVSVPRITWGGSRGPAGGQDATAVQLPASVATLGLVSLVRGDFDGDGHHDLAALAMNQSSIVILYGPFSRAGAPARSDTRLPWADGTLRADAIATSGKPRATSLLLHGVSDGEQSGNTLFRAVSGTGPSTTGTELRAGNALAFGDFDGDGRRDVAVGDDGSRNDEPGYETERPDVAGSYAVYPGSGAAPVTGRLPKAPPGAASNYGPGGFTAADPDGDGRDALLAATYDGAALIDGDVTSTVLRKGPASVNGRKTTAKWRHARPVAAADFDGDGKDELILDWGPGVEFGLYGMNPTRGWITDGTTSHDMAEFDTAALASGTR